MATATAQLNQLWLEFVGEDKDLDCELEDGSTPEEWIAQGFSPVGFQEWLKAGVFNPERVKELEAAGFEASEVSRRVTAEEEIENGFSYSGYSIAYMFCNGDLSIENVRKLVGNDA